MWDLDGNRYIEYGSGLRSVSLGHAHPRVLEAVRRELDRGSNFVRPSVVEIAAAERFLAAVPTAEMVKFAKNGSDATTAAVRLARAATGRERVALCAATIRSSRSTTGSSAPRRWPPGCRRPHHQLTLTFPYGDLAATQELLTRHRGEVACLVLEPAAHTEPPPGYLAGLRELADRHGCVLVFDEMITGFRWSEAGAQGLYGVVPDLSTFGKALGNGFAVSALAGRRELMERGGLRHPGDRVFLLSTTHGAETHALSAAQAVFTTYVEEGITARLHALGARLAAGVREAAASAGVGDHLVLRGRASNLVFATLDENRQPSQRYRTLFLRHLLAGGVLAPSFVVSSALEEADIDRTVEVVSGACAVYREGARRRRPHTVAGRAARAARVPPLGLTRRQRRAGRPRGGTGRPARRSAARSISRAVAGVTASAVHQPPRASVG